MSKKGNNMIKNNQYDVIVIGGGHAGCEAALSAARMGCNTLLITMNIDKIGFMSCNPAIGGVGKGQLVREIDALGGAMGMAADMTALQSRILNTSKGPAVQGTRTQNDKQLYHAIIKKILETQQNLDIRQAMVEKLVIEDGRIHGLIDHLGVHYKSSAVILATGTFLHGLIHIGEKIFHAGRAWEFSSEA